jgi:DNA repair protein RecN (Recombination protein N)
MLTELRIKNVAIIESLTLPLGPGFNVLTGETGAGKSIIVGALGLLLGERGAADVVRTGSDRATVEGVFDAASHPAVVRALDERGIDVEDGLVVLKREVSAAGRTRAWINGTSVTAAVLAEVGRGLVDLHGQHEAQSLLDADSQRRVLDAFAGATTDAAAVHEAHETLAAIKRAMAELTARRAAAEKRADYLRHVAKEIEEAKLTDGEETRLEDEARRLENASEIREAAAAFAAILDDEEAGVLSRLAQAARTLQQLQRFDPTLTKVQESFDAGFYSIESVSKELSEYASGVDLDPSRLGEVRTRRDLLFRLTKKYGATVTDVIAAGKEARRELDLVDTAGLDLRQLQARVDEGSTALAALGAALTKKRQEAGRRFATSVDGILPELGMEDGHLVVALTPLAAVGPHGAEEVEFRVALNLGHDLRPLARVASGGELSRVMLAIKTILARLDHVPTLVFDEVDAGIGGKVGQQVGDMLRNVAASHQVFAITHLPQIAAKGHRHIMVSKGARSGVTTADVTTLKDAERVVEVARMLGGDAESATSRAHAEEMLAAADAPPAPRKKRAPSTPSTPSAASGRDADSKSEPRADPA